MSKKRKCPTCKGKGKISEDSVTSYSEFVRKYFPNYWKELQEEKKEKKDTLWE